jgi:hypothetical protein
MTIIFEGVALAGSAAVAAGGAARASSAERRRKGFMESGNGDPDRKTKLREKAGAHPARCVRLDENHSFFEVSLTH